MFSRLQLLFYLSAAETKFAERRLLITPLQGWLFSIRSFSLYDFLPAFCLLWKETGNASYLPILSF
jgi:hypothetical protein